MGSKYGPVERKRERVAWLVASGVVGIGFAWANATGHWWLGWGVALLFVGAMFRWAP